jgi:hypothetical protein
MPWHHIFKACVQEVAMSKKSGRVEFFVGRVAFSADAVTTPKLDPNSKNLAERLAAKASDPDALAKGIDVTDLEKEELLKVLQSFPIISD